MSQASYSKMFLIDVEFFPADGDDPAGYVATNEELGLCVEADSLDALIERVRPVAMELFELNVLPSLKEDLADAPPAFRLSHLLEGFDVGKDLLPRLNRSA